jgi:chemotaxis protein CheD
MSGPSISHGKAKQDTTVGVGNIVVSNCSSEVIRTHSLGSCIAIAAYDCNAKAGGVLHFMLPDSSLSPQKAINQPAMFADTGIPLLFQKLSALQAERRHVKAFVAGGASVITGSDMFKIGERNIAATKKILIRLGITVIKADIGGVSNRALQLGIGTGEVLLKTTIGTAKLSLA